MKFVAKSQSNQFVASDECVIYEYPLDSPKVSSTTAEITGRYPLAGWALNEVCDELAYVVSGSGKLLTPEQELNLKPGGSMLIEKGEKFAWQGDKLVVFIPCFPAWDPAQYKHIEN